MKNKFTVVIEHYGKKARVRIEKIGGKWYE